MIGLRVRPLLVVAVVAAMIGWLVDVLVTRAGGPTPVLPLSSLFTVLLLVAITLGLGLHVLRWRQGKSRRMINPLLAARALVLAQATAYTGAVLGGWHVGVVIEQLGLLALRSDQSLLWFAVAQVAGGAVMVGTGVLVEYFCRIPPEDGENSGEGPQRSKGEYA
ncbi:hypothetical protein BKD30_05975 [Tersicoccus phoenicis]|uniref:DUF3180 domain-containing protein n=1 Tax=Tersicoccus phoenicis TaxID=554083 RepID=A0A1R1LD34_9MICC|nr:DUF3180 domain-containing protein [Tersicoccus phoenicis]OMH25442.1 hypothetical protein BKD30_05975 [Tersicoccus phoenicis]